MQKRVKQTTYRDAVFCDVCGEETYDLAPRARVGTVYGKQIVLDDSFLARLSLGRKDICKKCYVKHLNAAIDELFNRN